MARRGRWSSLRRRGTPAGGLALLCVVLAAPVQAATPTPDPPPAAVAPEAPPAAKPAPVPRASVPSPARIVRRRPSPRPPSPPCAPSPLRHPRRSRSRSPSSSAKRTVVEKKRGRAESGRPARPAARAASRPRPDGRRVEQRASALAGIGLAVVALGGALVADRRAPGTSPMRRLAVVLLASLVVAPSPAATPTVGFTMTGMPGPERLVPEQRHDSLGRDGVERA